MSFGFGVASQALTLVLRGAAGLLGPRRWQCDGLVGSEGRSVVETVGGGCCVCEAVRVKKRKSVGFAFKQMVMDLFYG